MQSLGNNWLIILSELTDEPVRGKAEAELYNCVLGCPHLNLWSVSASPRGGQSDLTRHWRPRKSHSTSILVSPDEKGKTESHQAARANKKSNSKCGNVYRTTDSAPAMSLGAGNLAGEEGHQGEVCSRLKDSRNITTKQTDLLCILTETKLQ